MSKDKNDRFGHKSDSKVSNGVLIGIGSAFLLATGGLSFFGSRAAINALNNSATDDITTIIAKNMPTPEPTVEPEPVLDDAWTTDQMRWMQENHITWNEEGFPINERGDVVDDPTTAVNEVERWEELQARRNQPEQPEPTPEPTPTPKPLPQKPAWCRDNDMIEIDEDGRLYYVVKDGDTLAWIAKQTGFTVGELADYNGIDDANAPLVPGTRIYFPLSGPTISEPDSNVGLG